MKPLWKLWLPLDGSKYNLFHFIIIHTPEALPHGIIQPITAAMLERFQRLKKLDLKTFDGSTQIMPILGGGFDFANPHMRQISAMKIAKASSSTRMYKVCI